MKEKFTIQLSPTRLKQIKKIAFSGSRAKLKILNGKFAEGFQVLKNTAQKLKSFATDLSDRIPQALATQVSLNLFSHFETKNSKRLGIPKGIVLGGILTLMCSLPALGQTPINAATTTDLINAINTANVNGANYEIRLEQGKTYTLGASLPNIANNGTLKIICTGSINAIIDGAGAHRPIKMNPNSNLIISKITIQNGQVISGNGGGIYNNNGNLTISNSIITNNEVVRGALNGRGAGIYSTGHIGGASVLIQNSTISLNSASSGGGISNQNNSLLTIFNSSISGNTSEQGGGIFNQINSPLTISNSSISGNTSKLQGGGIYNRYNSSLTISSSSISGNTATVGGGGVYNSNSNLSIQASSLSTNQVIGQGGGIQHYSYHGTQLCIIQNTTISGNTATVRGSGIHQHHYYSYTPTSTLTLQHVTISNNTGVGVSNTTNHGTAVFTLQNTIIANNTGNDFDLNGSTVNAASAGNIIRTGTGAVDGSVISTADPLLNALSGGVHTLQAGSPAIDGASTIAATTHDQLGVARVPLHDIGAVQFATSACVFDVTTNADTGVGSLRQAILDANANIDDCIIYLDGGKTYTIASNLPTIVDKATGGTLQIISTGTTNAIIDGAETYRPLTMTTGSNLTISKITIQNGKVTNGNGGGIYNNNGDLTVSNSIITNNEATGGNPNGYGAGIFSTGNGGNASVLIQNSTISLNSASRSGGGISNHTNSSLIISSSSISGNVSTNNGGGGVYNKGNSPSIISHSSVSNNTAGGGGGVMSHFNSPLTISNSFILNNTASIGGGVMTQINSPITISNSSISGNTATRNSNGGGGGIWIVGTPLVISSSSISENTTNGHGGGIYCTQTSMNIQASSIINNQANEEGGGMILFGSSSSDMMLRNTTISGNTSMKTGGGIYHYKINGVKAITLEHVTLSNNTGSGGINTGDGFEGKSSIIQISNSIIANSIGAGDDLHLSGASSIIVTASIIETSTTPITSASAIDPMLGALTLNSGFLIHSVKTTSPAIDAGANMFTTIPTDQVGNPRDINPTIGATEVTIPGVCMVVSAPTGVTNTWIGCTNDDWNTASNWSSGVVPTANDVVYVPIVAQTPLVIDEIVTCAKMVVQIGAKCKVDYNAGGRLIIKF